MMESEEGESKRGPDFQAWLGQNEKGEGAGSNWTRYECEEASVVFCFISSAV